MVNKVFYLLCIMLIQFPKWSQAECSQYYVLVQMEMIDGVMSINPINIDTALSTYPNATIQINAIQKNNNCILNLNCLNVATECVAPKKIKQNKSTHIFNERNKTVHPTTQETIEENYFRDTAEKTTTNNYDYITPEFEIDVNDGVETTEHYDNDFVGDNTTPVTSETTLYTRNKGEINNDENTILNPTSEPEEEVPNTQINFTEVNNNTAFQLPPVITPSTTTSKDVLQDLAMTVTQKNNKTKNEKSDSKALGAKAVEKDSVNKIKAAAIFVGALGMASALIFILKKGVAAMQSGTYSLP